MGSSCVLPLQLLQLLHSYNAKSILRGFQRTFALSRALCIIWIDAGLNITRSGKDLAQEEMKVISALNLKFAAIEFKVTLSKHHLVLEQGKESSGQSRTLSASPSQAPTS